MKAIPVLFLVVLALPGVAFAHNPAASISSPGAGFTMGATSTPAAAPTATPSPNAPHPSMPWSGVANPYGQVIRYIVMPAQPVEIASPTTSSTGATVLESRVVEIPGYTMAETTVGFYVPERWTLEQVGPGSYQWRLTPPRFFAK